ncbi:MAG: hypothetical protein HZC26_01130 [Candidatus Magasanikbacteria bacterium]|nr:hypothetical protein [Candidatus Magasanikbacteria bacterium]
MPISNTLNKLMRPTVGKSANFSALDKPMSTTSISRLNSSSNVRTSVFDKPTESVGAGGLNSRDEQAAMDDRRYGYVRGMIRQRQEKEAETAGASGTPSRFKLKFGTGAAFHHTRKKGLDWKLKEMRYKNLKALRHLSDTDIRFFGDMVKRYALSKRTGAGYNWIDKKHMKNEIARAWHAGKISRDDRKDFNTMVDQLE